MKAMATMTANHANCCSAAAVSTSAPILAIVDTAILLAVSICVLSLPLLRIIVP